jgi:hypothetical protein
VTGNGRAAWWLLVVFCLGVVAAQRAQAVTQYCWRDTASSSCRHSPYAACEDKAMRYTADYTQASACGGGIAGDSWGVNAITGTDVTNYNCQLVRHRTGSPDQTQSCTITRSNNGEAPSCPAAGTDGSANGTGSIPGSACVGGCLMTLGGVQARLPASGTWASGGKYTGRICGIDGHSKDTPQRNEGGCDPTGLICRDTGSGAANCGVYNGDRVCVTTVPPGACVGFASGGAACRGTNNGADAPATPPAPDNGTPGTAAAADAQVSTPTGGTAHYYGPGTVAGSSGGSTTGDPTSAPGTGSDPVGTPEPQPGECDEPGSCEGTLPSLEGGTPLEDSLTMAFDAVLTAPIVGAAVAAVDSWPTVGGSCPTFGDFEMYGESLNLGESLCGLWAEIAPIIGALMLAMWTWIAIRILLSA